MALRSWLRRSVWRPFVYVAAPFVAAVVILGSASCARGTAYYPCLLSNPLRYLEGVLIAVVVSIILAVITVTVVRPVLDRILHLDDQPVLQWNRQVKTAFVPVLVVTGTVLHSVLQVRYMTSAGDAFAVSALDRLFSGVSMFLLSFSFEHGLEYVNLSLVSQYLSFALAVFVVILAVNTYVTMVIVNVVRPVLIRRQVVRSIVRPVQKLYGTPYRKVAIIVLALLAGLAYGGGSDISSGFDCRLSETADEVRFEPVVTDNGVNVTVVVEDYNNMDVLYLQETGAGLAHEIYFDGEDIGQDHGYAMFHTVLPNGTFQVTERPLQDSGVQGFHARGSPESPVLNVTFAGLADGDRVIAEADQFHRRRGCDELPYPTGTYEVGAE